MKFDKIEQNLKYSFDSGQIKEPISQSEVPNNAGIAEGSNGSSSAQLESSEAVMLNRDGDDNLTNCVWCGMEFRHEEGVDSEIQQMQSDSVGYMCPTCKAKISGPLSGMGTG